MVFILMFFRFLMRQWRLPSVSFAVKQVTVLGLLVIASLVIPVSAQDQELVLTKSLEGGDTTAEIGDVLRYRVRFECSSLSNACGELEILDALPPGLIYLPPPQSSIPTGFSIAYDSPARAITITKDDDMFLDGTQFDAVLTLQVDYNLLPAVTTITNVLTGRIRPPGASGWIDATPAEAEPVTIDAAIVDWDLDKRLINPIVNPTVDTNVTYELALCPNSTSGNVPLRDITLTDTLPPNALFVEASDGGTETGGVVTWPFVAGPITPPDCLRRTVTVQYPDADFSPGDSVTNQADADSSYADWANGGNVAPNGESSSITHDLVSGTDLPVYSKDDVGDPVGLTGTGRFILNLDTEDSNIPSDGLVLVDNLPPELRVFEVTSGQWDADFDTVQALVAYSTDDGGTWTDFSALPASYNTDATYNATLPENITNVRWTFSYTDAGGPQNGLPSGWRFTEPPEIRVTPRSTPIDTTAIPPVSLPAAVSGSTYDNCLLIRRASLPDTTCDVEPMTVEDGLLSVRVYKEETAGARWNQAADPTITSFISDNNLLPNDTLRYVLTLELTERSSIDLVNPTIRDTLPDGLTFVRSGTARLDGVALTPAQQPTFTNNSPDLMWEFTTLIVTPRALGSRLLTVEFFARVPPGQAAVPYTNTVIGLTNAVNVVCEVGSAINDGGLDGCSNIDTYVVEQSASLRGEKWIRSTDPLNTRILNSFTFAPSAACPNGGTVGLPGGGTNTFTRYPCIATAYADGANPPGLPTNSTTLDDFEYNIRILNEGNVDMVEYVLYDILPYTTDVGSGGSLASTPRLSFFQPRLLGPVAFISGPVDPISGAPLFAAADFVIQYNNTNNPCRPEVFNAPTGAALPAGCNDVWSNSWSGNARSFRIRMMPGNVLQPTSLTPPELRFGLPMYIPAAIGDPTIDAVPREISWNSFAHVATYLDLSSSRRRLLASEPRKVGIAIPEFVSDTPDDDEAAAAATALAAAANGSTPLPLTLTKSAEPPFVLPGGDVSWRIIVTNPNAQPVTNITVSDDVPSALEVLSASAPSGTVVINGQQVTLTLVQIDAQTSITLMVLTRVRPGANLLEIRNVAVLSGPQTVVAVQSTSQSAQSGVLVVTQLPNTGETPLWRSRLLTVLGVALLIGAAGLTMEMWRQKG